MNTIHRVISFLHYLIRAKTIFYIHSPFVYKFYKTVLTHQKTSEFLAISTERKRLNNNNETIKVNDFGTGKSQQLPLSVLAKKVAIKEKYGRVLFHLVHEYKPKNVIEIGTSIGISACYLAKANALAEVHCLEGNKASIQLAKQLHKNLNLNNIVYIEGDFAHSLPILLHQIDSVDLVFFDGNHTKEATLNYFEWCIAKTKPDSILVFDDIYWSKEMTEAWTIIKNDQRIKLTIDLYQLGICFLKQDKIAKEDFTLLY